MRVGASTRCGRFLAVLYEVRDEGIAVVVALSRLVGSVDGVSERHDGQYGHHRHEEEADQDQHQQPRERPSGTHNGAHGNSELPEELIWLWRGYDPAKTEQQFTIEDEEKAKPFFRVRPYNR